MSYTYRISDRFYVTQAGQDRGVVAPSKVSIFLALFKGGKGRWGAWAPLVDWF